LFASIAYFVVKTLYGVVQSAHHAWVYRTVNGHGRKARGVCAEHGDAGGSDRAVDTGRET
jgi:hypothetical protein